MKNTTSSPQPVQPFTGSLGVRDDVLEPPSATSPAPRGGGGGADGPAITAQWLRERAIQNLRWARAEAANAETYFRDGLTEQARAAWDDAQEGQWQAMRHGEKLVELAVGSYVALHCPLDPPATETLEQYALQSGRFVDALLQSGELAEREPLFTERNDQLARLWREWDGALVAMGDLENTESRRVFTDLKARWQPRYDALYESYCLRAGAIGERFRPWHERQRPSPRPPCTPIPRSLPQQTGQPIRTINAAFGDAPTLRRWSVVEGQTALRHVIEKWPLQTLLTPGRALSWWGREDSVENLQDELRKLGIDGVFLVSVLTGLCLQEGQVTIALDELIRALGRGDEARRSRADRDRVAREVWRAILLFDALAVVGRPIGRYTTRDTNETLDVSLSGTEAIIRITGITPGQLSSDGSSAPALFSYVCGPWIGRMKGNRQILTEIGDVMNLARVPSGKPSGAWAKGIGLNLQQRWREWGHAGRVSRPAPA